MSMNADFAKYGMVLFALAMITGLGAAQSVGDNEVTANLTSPTSADSPFTLGTDDGINVSADLQFGSNLSNMSYQVDVYEQGAASDNGFKLVDVQAEEAGNISVDETLERSQLEDNNISYSTDSVVLELAAEATNESDSTVTATDSVTVDVQEPVIDIVAPEDESEVEIAEDETANVEIQLDAPADAENITVTLAENSTIDENTTTVNLVDTELTEDLVETEFTLSDVSEFESETAVVDVELTGSNLSEPVTEQSQFTVTEDTGIVDEIDSIIGDNIEEEDSGLVVGGGIVVVAVIFGLAIVGYRKFY